MIRPLDLQNALLAGQGSAAVVRGEAGARIEAQATQAAFVSEVARREQSVTAAQAAVGNRIDAKPEREPDRDSSDRPKRQPRFERVVDGSLEAGDDLPHIIDLMA